MTPTGLPAWTRSATHAQYGGDTSKRNLLSQGVVDPTTDVSADEFARICADLTACVLTAPFCVVTFLCNDSSPAAPTIEFVNMMTGTVVASYAGDAPPSGYPSATRNGTGDVTFTFASSYTDPYGVSGSFAIQHHGATAQGSGAYKAVSEKLSATTVRVRVFSAGVATGDKRVTLEVS